MIINDLPSAWLPLADAVAKATLILLLAAIASFALRHASAALRHLVWTLALCSALMLPVLSLALPKWQLPLVTIGDPAPAVAAPLETATATGPAVRALRLGRASDTRTSSSSASNATAPAPSREPEAGISLQTALAGLWLLGAAVILSRVLVGLAAVRLLSRRTQEITDAAWLPMARDVAREMGVTPRLRFLRSGQASMPVAAGIFRPSVIMPADADSWSENRLRVVLLHELAHVKRRDCLTHILAQAACAFYWFNPLAWLAVKKARTERERACDDLVLACGTRGSEYADQLLEMARALRGDRFPALLDGASLAMAHRSQLEGRLIAILDPRVPRSGVSRSRAVAAVALACCAVAPLGALQPWVSRAEPLPHAGQNAALALGTAVIPDQSPAAPVPSSVDVPRPLAAPADIATAAHEKTEQARQTDSTAVMPQPHPFPEPHPRPLMNGHETTIAGGTATSVGEAVMEALAQEPKTPAPPPERVSKADPRMVAALTAALKDTDKEVRETAMHALVQMRDPAVFEPLLQALKDSSPEVREQAAFGLGQFRDRRAVQPLVATLKDENPSVREQSAFALGQLRDPAAVDGLATAVRDANASVREQAVFALSQIRDRRAVEPLISALKDAQPDVRQQAAFGLGQLRDRAAVEALIIAIRDTDKEVREQVVFALGQLRDPRAIDALTTALKDQNAEVRKQAAFALGQLAR
jgi:beta-lactamase regulating signal transducer with metallopeptidase domain